MATYSKRQAALAQLETALKLYEDGGDLFSVITLAGAAEEILGRLVAEAGKEHSLAAFAKSMVGMYEHDRNQAGEALIAGEKRRLEGGLRFLMNQTRNELKHYTTGKGDAFEIADLAYEASTMLARAVGNCWYVENNLTAAMVRFLAKQLGKV